MEYRLNTPPVFIQITESYSDGSIEGQVHKSSISMPKIETFQISKIFFALVFISATLHLHIPLICATFFRDHFFKVISMAANIAFLAQTLCNCQVAQAVNIRLIYANSRK